jgi:hypothetical protein
MQKRELTVPQRRQQSGLSMTHRFSTWYRYQADVVIDAAADTLSQLAEISSLLRC